MFTFSCLLLVCPSFSLPGEKKLNMIYKKVFQKLGGGLPLGVCVQFKTNLQMKTVRRSRRRAKPRPPPSPEKNVYFFCKSDCPCDFVILFTLYLLWNRRGGGRDLQPKKKTCSQQLYVENKHSDLKVIQMLSSRCRGGAGGG